MCIIVAVKISMPWAAIFFRTSKQAESRSIYTKCQMAISGVFIMYLEIPKTLAASVGETEGQPHGDKCCWIQYHGCYLRCRESVFWNDGLYLNVGVCPLAQVAPLELCKLQKAHLFSFLVGSPSQSSIPLTSIFIEKCHYLGSSN